MKNRRSFFMAVAIASSTLAQAVRAQPRLDEKDSQATALGYLHDASKIDPKKQPKYAVGQVCSNCTLYQGKTGDAWGGCPIFGAKQVAAKGWCNAWAKKG